ncbi:hypothetical protein [Paenibacillus sp. QZ-Y1]|uniref:hypothetical protein n=1 Tax=Paenibacillus sp. QZ-Y1 TaxID=3414511 RepID=UPI003F7A4031
MSLWSASRIFLLLLVVLLLTSFQTLQGELELKPSISMNELQAFAENGDQLGWDDFAAYAYEDEGSGLYIRMFSIEGGHQLLVIGKSLDRQPDHVYVKHKDGKQIDLLKENIEKANLF